MPVSTGLDWRPYDSHGTTSRVREIVKRGAVEFELCCEGGQDVIRRTERRGKNVIVREVGRRMTTRETRELWERVTSGEAA